MVDHDVLIEKVNQIQACLARIHSKVNDDVSRLDDLDIQDIVVLNLQRAIQVAIDIAFHILSTEKLGLPQNTKDAFLILKNEKVINSELADKMARMTGFRNVVVHEYQKVSLEILKNIIQHRLPDIEEFYSVVLQHYKVAS